MPQILNRDLDDGHAAALCDHRQRGGVGDRPFCRGPGLGPGDLVAVPDFLDALCDMARAGAPASDGHRIRGSCAQ